MKLEERREKEGIAYSDEKPKRRARQSGYSHIIWSLARDAFRTAQHVGSGQGFRLPPRLPGGTSIVPHPGHLFTLGFTRRLALQLGHFAFMSLILLSLPMGGSQAL